MNIEIILSLLSALCSLIGSLGGILVTSKLSIYRLEQLEKKVDKHNHLVERMYGLEDKINVQGEQMRAVNRRISHLEHKEG